MMIRMAFGQSLRRSWSGLERRSSSTQTHVIREDSGERGRSGRVGIWRTGRMSCAVLCTSLNLKDLQNGCHASKSHFANLFNLHLFFLMGKKLSVLLSSDSSAILWGLGRILWQGVLLDFVFIIIEIGREI